MPRTPVRAGSIATVRRRPKLFCERPYFSCFRGGSWLYVRQMENELTAAHPIPLDPRSARSTDAERSARPPGRGRAVDHQGARLRSPLERAPISRLESARSTVAVVSPAGGASSSKWARRSRPWNASSSTAAVATPSIRETWLSPDDSAWRAQGGACCGQVALEGSRILGSPVQRASGRGRPAPRLLLCV